MQNKDKDKYMGLSDDFSNKIKQKLENHRMPVDEMCWEAIETQVTPAINSSRSNNKKTILRWISGVAAVAAVLTLVLLFMPDNKPISEMAVIHEDTNNSFSEKEPTQNSFVKTPEKVVQEEKVMAARIVYQEQDIRANNTDVSEEDESNINTGSTVPTNIKETPIDKESDEKISEESQKEPQPTRNNRDTRQQNEPRILIGPKTKGNNDKWLLAASFSSGSTSSTNIETVPALKDHAVQNGVQNPLSVKDPGEANSRMLADNDFTDSDHSLPLSFGISVRKDLNKYLGIETGLTYTYLSSTFERVNIPQYKSKREIHYLGVPVNLVIYLWNDPKWNVYVSGGAMLEKGVKQKYVQDMYQNNVKISSTTDKGSVSGVQWSLNAAAGISYAVYQDLSIYAEPRFSHYFNNNQPASIRTEKSNVFSLGGGLRFKF